MATKVEKTDEQWRQELTPEQYEVTRKAGTERAFTGPFWDNHEAGSYDCVCCGTELFDSDTKFDSGTGWPSFTEPKNLEHVELRRDLQAERVDGLAVGIDLHPEVGDIPVLSAGQVPCGGSVDPCPLGVAPGRSRLARAHHNRAARRRRWQVLRHAQGGRRRVHRRSEHP